MFGIGGGEIIFILLVILMLFGSDKIPEMARAAGKFMAQLKNATNDIKSEIQKGVDSITDDTSLGDIKKEIDQAKENLIGDATNPLSSIKDEFENLTGPIKRQF